jgi:hypothetical protein
MSKLLQNSNQKYVQLNEIIPFGIGKYLYSSYEINYDTSYGIKFTKNHMSLPIIIVVIYIISIFIGIRYMENRKRMDLRNKLAIWNACLSFFSLLGSLRTVPDLIYQMANKSLIETITMPSYKSWGNGATGLWVQLFIFSKIPELFDTYFIIARKRNLIFLHWYHHVTVLLYCWHSYATEAPQTLYFVAMNYAVHSIMYGYYCLMALKMKPKWLPAEIITIAQILQMLVGVIIQVVSGYVFLTEKSYAMNGSNIFWGGVMYGSYFLLFSKFALNRYFNNTNKIK